MPVGEEKLPWLLGGWYFWWDSEIRRLHQLIWRVFQFYGQGKRLYLNWLPGLLNHHPCEGSYYPDPSHPVCESKSKPSCQLFHWMKRPSSLTDRRKSGKGCSDSSQNQRSETQIFKYGNRFFKKFARKDNWCNHGHKKNQNHKGPARNPATWCGCCETFRCFFLRPMRSIVLPCYRQWIFLFAETHETKTFMDGWLALVVSEAEIDLLSGVLAAREKAGKKLDPLTWNLKMEFWMMIFLFNRVIFFGSMLIFLGVHSCKCFM